MHLVLGIVLIIILVCWNGLDKVNGVINRAERESAEENDPYIQWVKQNTDPDMEKQIWNEWNPFGEEATLIFKRLKDEGAISEYIEQDSALEEIRRAKFAQSGKLPVEIAKHGVRGAGFDSFMKWYDEELRRNGFKDNMYFVDSGKSERLKWDDFSECFMVSESQSHNLGKFFWIPIKDYLGFV